MIFEHKQALFFKREKSFAYNSLIIILSYIYDNYYFNGSIWWESAEIIATWTEETGIIIRTHKI